MKKLLRERDIGKEEKRLIPFRECTCSECCRECSFKIRSDAEYFAEKLLSVSLPKIKEKAMLLSYAVKIPQALKKHTVSYSQNEAERLCNCTIIKYIRKAELNVPYSITLSEIKKIIEISKIKRGE